jgi:hypothetical protein
MEDMLGRTLNEMTRRERSDMMAMVADALEAVAEEAQDRGDARSAQNSICLALTVRGCAVDLNERDLHTAELLLEQGITFVASISERLERTRVSHEAATALKH